MINYATNYAIIKNNIVTNVIWGYISEEENNRQNTDNEYFIQIDNLNVQIGDTYDPNTNKFFRNGEPIKRVEEMMYQNYINDLNDLINIIYEMDNEDNKNE